METPGVNGTNCLGWEPGSHSGGTDRVWRSLTGGGEAEMVGVDLIVVRVEEERQRWLV